MSYFKKNEAAISLYSELLEKDPKDVDALVGIAKAGIEMGNADHLIFAFEGLMRYLGMPANMEISSLAGMAILAGDIGKALEQAGDPSNTSILMDIASKLDPECQLTQAI